MVSKPNLFLYNLWAKKSFVFFKSCRKFKKSKTNILQHENCMTKFIYSLIQFYCHIYLSPFVDILSFDIFWLNWIIVILIVWSAEPKMFIIWHLIEKVGWFLGNIHFLIVLQSLLTKIKWPIYGQIYDSAVWVTHFSVVPVFAPKMHLANYCNLIAYLHISKYNFSSCVYLAVFGSFLFIVFIIYCTNMLIFSQYSYLLELH